MVKTSLVIMAAGIGSRFKGGIKQLTPMGPNGEIVIDYSIHDAIKAGFNKIVIILRKEIEADFREVIGTRIDKACENAGVEVKYAFQSLEDLPDGFALPSGRTKPWGTGQAVLAAAEIINEPFLVINADDYYGRNCFKLMHEFLVNDKAEKEYAMAGFFLANTLSDNGGVTRGICSVKNGYLTDVVETHNIIKTATGAESDGRNIPVESIASMNMWAFTPDFLAILKKGFTEFLADIKAGKKDALKGEYLIPVFVGELLEKGEISVKVIPTDDKWFGMTYKEDVPVVKKSFSDLIASGVYHANLYEDLDK